MRKRLLPSHAIIPAPPRPVGLAGDPAHTETTFESQGTFALTVPDASGDQVIFITRISDPTMLDTCPNNIHSMAKTEVY